MKDDTYLGSEPQTSDKFLEHAQSSGSSDLCSKFIILF
jgi:hypothetical protein